MTLSLVKFPEQHAVQNIPEALRSLADGRVEMGLMGPSPQPALTAYFLAGLAQRKLEGGIG